MWRRATPDQYYLFYSGGQSGNIFVAGVPSMRHISTIPVFSPTLAPDTGSTRKARPCWVVIFGETRTMWP